MTVSRPGRYLTVLVALIIVMNLTVLGGTLIHPSAWHTKFKVALGLDLSSGTTFTIQAATSSGGTPTSGQMGQSIAILNSRLNGQGFTGATVQQQGSNFIVVSVPNKSAEDIAPLLQSAVLRFRQVLYEAGGSPAPLAKTPPPVTSTPPPSPSPSPSGSPKSSASPSPSASTKSSASPSPSASKSASGGSGQASSARLISAAAATPSPSASAKTSASPKPSASAPASPSPSPTPNVSTPPLVTRLPQVGDGTGDISMVHSAAVIKDFNRLNCKDKLWQKVIYGNTPSFDNPNQQVVACGPHDLKYILDVAKVQGQNLRNVQATLNPQTNVWVVAFGLDSAGQTAFGNLTTNMYTHYFNASTQQQTSVLDDFAIVLDGKVVSAPQIIQPITTGSGEIDGGQGAPFTQGYANQLASVLKYGAVPVAFKQQTFNSISAQLGSAQLTAVLIAAAVGLFLVVVYSFIYYRGLALVSVFSLATAALLAWLSVIVLGKAYGFTLSLAGVAGLIVAIGITADSFVVFFERLRDEVREGKSLRAAVERGWGRARRTILVSDTVSFLAALLLYIFAIGDVKGFAFTLGLTTLIDIVVVFLFTKPMVTLLARTKFYGQGNRWSGLDPSRLGARSPWRGSRPVVSRPATGGAASARTTPKEA